MSLQSEREMENHEPTHSATPNNLHQQNKGRNKKALYPNKQRLQYTSKELNIDIVSRHSLTSRYLFGVVLTHVSDVTVCM